MLIMVGIASFSISFSTGSVVIRRNLDSGDCLEKAFCFNSCAASLYYTQSITHRTADETGIEFPDTAVPLDSDVVECC